MAARPKKEAPRADLLEKEPSQMHEDLTAYIAEQTGYEADLKTVQMVTTLRSAFRRTEEYKASKEERAAEREAEKERKAAARAERGTSEDGETLTRAQKRAAKRAAAKQAAPSAGTGPRKKAAAKKPAKKAASKGRKVAASAGDAEEPF